MLISKKEERLGEVRIDLGCKEFKFKDKLFEKNYRKVYDAGKYLRWDASDKTWDKHIKRLKEILSNPDIIKNTRILRLGIMCHGSKKGFIDIDDGGSKPLKPGEEPTDDNINKADRPLRRFVEFMEVIKDFMEENKQVRVYVHGIPCYGALFIPCSYSKNDYLKDGKPVISELVDKSHPTKYRPYAPTIYSVMQQLLGDQFSGRVMCSQNLPNSDVSHSIENKPRCAELFTDHPSKYYITLTHILGDNDARMQFRETCHEKIDKRETDKQKILNKMKEIRDNNPEYKGKILIGAEECNIYFPLSAYNNSFLGIYNNNNNGDKTLKLKNSQNYFEKINGPKARKVKNDFINEARKNIDNNAVENAKEKRRQGESSCCCPWF